MRRVRGDPGKDRLAGRSLADHLHSLPREDVSGVVRWSRAVARRDGGPIHVEAVVVVRGIGKRSPAVPTGWNVRGTVIRLATLCSVPIQILTDEHRVVTDAVQLCGDTHLR